MKHRIFCICILLILTRTTVASTPIEEGISAIKQRDFGKAHTLFSAEAKKGNPSGYYYLGRLLEQGLGTTPNITEAAKHYRKAFEALSQANKAAKTQTAQEPGSSTTSSDVTSDSAPTPPSGSPDSGTSSDPYARPEGMSDTEWRTYCQSKACEANRNLLTGAVELYNLQHPEMITTLTDEDTGPNGRLVKAGSLKEPIRKSLPACSYSSEGDIMSVDDWKVKCSVHGSGSVK